MPAADDARVAAEIKTEQEERRFVICQLIDMGCHSLLTQEKYLVVGSANMQHGQFPVTGFMAHFPIGLAHFDLNNCNQTEQPPDGSNSGITAVVAECAILCR